MKAVDSSVVIAAFAGWHEHHAISRKAMTARPRLIAHAAVESYSVLTRLPPHRASLDIARSFITERFTDLFLTLSENGYQELLATVAAGQIPGGPAYDALIAFTAAEHDATLLSLDQRAASARSSGGPPPARSPGRPAAAQRRRDRRQPGPDTPLDLDGKSMIGRPTTEIVDLPA